jgi:hypothetical protein
MLDTEHDDRPLRIVNFVDDPVGAPADMTRMKSPIRETF